ncbi:MAG: thioredoxin family protein [Anaerolineae bacterium]
MAKPFVDGLEKDLTGKAEVIRLDILSSVGREAARRYGVRATPTRIVLDGQGQLVYGEVGWPNSRRILAQVDSVIREQLID